MSKSKANKLIFFLLGSLKLGGTEVVANRTGLELSKRGYTVKYVLLKDIQDITEGIDKTNLILLRSERYKHKPIKFVAALLNFWWFYLKNRPAYVVSFSAGMNVFLFCSIVPRQVWTVDTNLFWVKSKLYRRWLLKYVGYLPMVSRVIVPSHGLRERFRGYLPLTSYKKMHTIFNPVALNHRIKQFNSPKNNLVCVGRLTRGKGAEQLIRCFLKASKPPDAQLLFYGTGKYEHAIRKIIERSGAEDRVHLMGFCNDIQYEISDARSLVLNSKFESFGNVLIEALSVQIPVISNDCDFGPREIIVDQVNGLLIDNSIDENLTKAIELIYNNQELYDTMRKNTTVNLNRFSVECIADIWEENIFKRNT